MSRNTLRKWPTRCNCVGQFVIPLFLDCSTCFERYYRSSSGASKLYSQLLVLFTYVVECWWHMPRNTLRKWPTRCNCVGQFVIPLFLDCSTCFERYYRSSSGASKLYSQLLVLFTYVVECWWHMPRNTLRKWPTRCNCVGQFVIPLFLDCSTCFERYYRSSSGASKLYSQLLVLFRYVVECWRHMPRNTLRKWPTRCNCVG